MSVEVYEFEEFKNSNAYVIKKRISPTSRTMAACFYYGENSMAKTEAEEQAKHTCELLNKNNSKIETNENLLQQQNSRI